MQGPKNCEFGSIAMVVVVRVVWIIYLLMWVGRGTEHKG